MTADVIDGSGLAVSGGASGGSSCPRRADGLDLQHLEDRDRGRGRRSRTARGAAVSNLSRMASASAEGHGQRLMGACVFQMRPVSHADAVGVDALAATSDRPRRTASSSRLCSACSSRSSPAASNCASRNGADIGEAHAVGRQHAGEGVQEHRRHAQRIGHEAGVLPAGAAEAVERVFRHVIAALDGDLLDRVGHVLDGDAQEAFATSSGVRGASRRRSRGQGREFLARRRRRRAAGRRPARRRREMKSGCSLPSMTLQSVTVSGPPRR
jgi:hypothetical protein